MPGAVGSGLLAGALATFFQVVTRLSDHVFCNGYFAALAVDDKTAHWLLLLRGGGALGGVVLQAHGLSPHQW